MSKATDLQDQLREARNELEQWRVFGTPIELRARFMTMESASKILERDITEYIRITKKNSEDYVKAVDGLRSWIDDLADKNKALYEENEKLRKMLVGDQELNPFVQWEKYQESLRQRKDVV